MNGIRILNPHSRIAREHLLHLKDKSQITGNEAARKPDCDWIRVRLWHKAEVMSRVIPFYVPDTFKPKTTPKGVGKREPAKVIQFRPAEAKKPA